MRDRENGRRRNFDFLKVIPKKATNKKELNESQKPWLIKKNSDKKVLVTIKNSPEHKV